MRALNYLELESRLARSGIGTATAHQRAALESTDVEVLTSPWAGGVGKSLRSALAGGGAFVDFDVAHCNTIGPGTVTVARYARRNDLPLVLHAHVVGEDFAESYRCSTALVGPLRRYLGWLYSQADLLLCPSRYAKRRLTEYVDVPVRPVSNGVDVDSLAGHERLRPGYRARFDLEGTVVATLGNVFERKGLTTFCRLARETDYEFAWFGPYDTGPLASETVRTWTRSPPENVTFTGWVDDKRGALGAGDVFLFPTKMETQGIAVLEAMACGKPVVLRDIPVFEEFYTHGEDCLKCETRAEFREALAELDANPALRERLGANARETARSHSLEGFGTELASIYRAVGTDA